MALIQPTYAAPPILNLGGGDRDSDPTNRPGGAPGPVFGSAEERNRAIGMGTTLPVDAQRQIRIDNNRPDILDYLTNNYVPQYNPDGTRNGYVTQQGAAQLPSGKGIDAVPAGAPGATSPQIQAEMQRVLERGNLIGDSFQNAGNSALNNLGRLADEQATRGNVIGDAFQNNYGNPNAARQSNYANDAYGYGRGLDAQGKADYDAQALTRLQQLSAAGSAEGRSAFAFDTAMGYGDTARSDYASQRDLAAAQAAQGARSAAQANMQFAQSRAFGADAQQADAAQQAARAQQLGFGQQGAGYAAQDRAQAGLYGGLAANAGAALGQTQAAQMGLGQQFGGYAAGNMASAAGYGRQAGAAGDQLQRTQATQMGLGQGAGRVSAANEATSGQLLGQAGQSFAAQQAARGDTQAALDRLRGFYEQGPGPSAAEAQLRQQSQRDQASAIALARSGRGAGDSASALRSAMFSNAATAQQTRGQAAQLRAQESDAFRGRQLQAMGMEQQGLGSLRGQDQAAYGQALGSAGQFAGLGYQGMGLNAQQANQVAGQQAQREATLLNAQQQQAALGYQGMGLNAQQANTVASQQLQQQQAMLQAQQAQAGLSYQGLGLGAQQANQGRGQDLQSQQQSINAMTALAGLGYQGLGQQQAATQAGRSIDAQMYQANLGAQQAQTGFGMQGLGLQQQALQSARAGDLQAMSQNYQTGLAHQQMGQQYEQMGLNNQLAWGQMANQQYMQSDQLAAQMRQAAFANQLQWAGLANDQYQNADQLRNAQLLAQLSAETSRYGADKGVSIGMAQIAQQRQAAQLAAGATLAGGVIGMMSDVRSKENITPEDVSAAFSGGGPFSGGGSKPKGKKRKPKNFMEKLFGNDESYDKPDTNVGIPPPPEPGDGASQRAPMRGVREIPLPGTPSFEQSISPFAPQTAPPVDLGGPVGRQAPRGAGGRAPSEFSMPDSYWETLDQALDGQGYGYSLNQPTMPQYGWRPGAGVMSDERSKYVSSPREAKRDIRPVSMAGAPAEYADAWRGVSLADSMAPRQEAPAYSFAARPKRPGTDLRPAQGYSYEYKDPSAPGAAPGRHFGPMAQDLEKTPAGKSVVETGPNGMKRINAPRLTLVNTSAIAEQQRRLDRLEELAGKVPTDALDAAYQRQMADTGSRFGGRR